MPLSENPRHLLPQLIKRLAGDSVRVAEGELALALLELKQIIRSYVTALVFGVASVATMIIAIAFLAQALALALTPILGSAAYAFLAVVFILVIITFGMAWFAKRSFAKKHTPIGLIFKWLNTATKTD